MSGAAMFFMWACGFVAGFCSDALLEKVSRK